MTHDDSFRGINSQKEKEFFFHGKYMAPQGRYWLLTINDSDDGNSWQRPDSLEGQYSDVQWLRGQKEVGSNTGRPHWQLFVSFRIRKRLGAIKQLFGDRCHAELTRSEAAESYVFKDDTAIVGTRFELGEKAVNRNSSADWSKITDLARTGQISRILDEFGDIAVRHYNALKHISRDYMVPPKDMNNVCGIWIYGPPGVGKSHFARECYGNDIYLKMCNKWWDGYRGQKTVLIDDLDKGSKVLGHHIKLWADKYTFLAESKGHTFPIRPDRIVVTSNYKIEEIWTDDESMCEAIRRRFYYIFIPFKRG